MYINIKVAISKSKINVFKKSIIYNINNFTIYLLGSKLKLE
jgi:hypothetical protein